MATDPATGLARLAASVAVPDGPVEVPPTSMNRLVYSHDALSHTLRAAVEGAGVQLGEYDRGLLAWLAHCGGDVALTLTSLFQRVHQAGLTHGAGEHTRDGSCCGLLAGDV